MQRWIYWFVGLILLVGSVRSSAQPNTIEPPFAGLYHHAWVDSVFNSLSADERIAQLLMVAAFSNKGDEHKREILNLISAYKIGGLIFMQGGPARQARLMNTYQSVSKVPLLMAMDAEWGLGMRLDSTVSYPYQMTLGAIQNDSLIYYMGEAIAHQMKRAGLHVNFAPVVDVNNNPNNPVINFRSFGENKNQVARKAIAYMQGMQDNGILATAKHFPGHGDTDADSHYSLPILSHSRQRLDSLELYPFRELIRAGIGGVMVAHLNVPALDSSGVPTTLSRLVITDLLRKKMKFSGLIVTDAMNMRGVTTKGSPGIVDREAILAGNDLLEFTEDVPRAIQEIKRGIREGKISQREIDEKCRKVLAIKYWAGLYRKQSVIADGICNDLSTTSHRLLNRNLLEAAITVLRNENDMLPIRDLDSVRIASVSIGRNNITPFQQTLSLYTHVHHFTIPATAPQHVVDSIDRHLKNYNLVIAGIHDEPGRPRNRIAFSEPVMNLIQSLSMQPKSIVAVFKNPYTLEKLTGTEQAEGLIVTYQDNSDVEELTAQLIFGGIGSSGRLPVSIAGKFLYGSGLDVKGGIRFKYTLPEDAGLNAEILYGRIDSLVQQALDAKAIPGCQVLVAKDMKVVLHKAYGFQDYSDTVNVQRTDLYDLASITKISTSLPALMRLYDENKFELNATLSTYLPEFRKSNKADILMYDILTHQARFKPWIPFWKKTVKDNGKYKHATIRKDSSEKYSIRLTNSMYLNRNYPDKIVKEIRKSALEPEKKYVYSDFFFILAPKIVERMISETFESYLEKNFYIPLGATSVMYNPLRRYPLNAIVPTEHDFNFRHQPIHGVVHDEGAVMMRGVSGHAGLFANANDLAKLMQMYLNGGEYGGRKYLKSETLQNWTRTQFPENNNRRALGFDKPNLQYAGTNNNTARAASANSFGHTGFTGTFAWMDPDTDLLYIFLSNRVNPTRANTRLYQLNTRTQIQQVMYDALTEPTAINP